MSARPPLRRTTGGGPVAHGDELALPAGLEARGHEEEVRAGVDAAGLVPVEAVEHDDAVGMLTGVRFEAGHELLVAAAEHDEPRAQRRRARAPPR